MLTDCVNRDLSGACIGQVLMSVAFRRRESPEGLIVMGLV
jgi:hypothetical protein